MIRFICDNVDSEEVKKVVKKEYIDFVAGVISPLFGDYDGTGLDYSSCGSDEDKRHMFAEHFLGDIDIEVSGNEVILNDMLSVEGTSRGPSDWFDLEQFILEVKSVYPSLKVSGEGEIDYDSYMSEYEIIDEDGVVRVIYDGEE